MLYRSLAHAYAIAALTLAFELVAVGPLQARAADPAALCDAAAREAAASVDVPLEVLLAITRVETGRAQGGQLAPWPWAINRGGEGFWFDTADEAIAFADSELAAGGINFDVGCFQINLRWHSKGFASLQDMFDPLRNAEYAARFLADLYQSEGGWPEAVAAYHSRSPDLAAAYLSKVESVLGGLGDPANSPEQFAAVGPPETRPRVNQFPLLQAGAQGGFGSLVPAYAPGTPMFGNAP